MNPSEALDEDDPAPQVAWLQSGVLSAGALAVVLVPHHNPGHATLLQRGKNNNNTAVRGRKKQKQKNSRPPTICSALTLCKVFGI